MKVNLAIPLLAAVIILSGCIMQSHLTVSEIQMFSDFISPTNYTEIKEEVIGDEQTVIFYLETRDYKTKKVNNVYEFWISIDIIISDEWNNTYVEKIDEKEIHSNSTERSGMVWYKYSWFTGNMVRSGWYTVRIVVKDRLADEIKEAERKFYVDLSRIY